MMKVAKLILKKMLIAPIVINVATKISSQTLIQELIVWNVYTYRIVKLI